MMADKRLEQLRNAATGGLGEKDCRELIAEIDELLKIVAKLKTAKLSFYHRQEFDRWWDSFVEEITRDANAAKVKT